MNKPLSGRYHGNSRRMRLRRRRYSSPAPVDLTTPIEYSPEYRRWLRDMLDDIRSERRHGIARGFDIGVA